MNFLFIILLSYFLRWFGNFKWTFQGQVVTREQEIVVQYPAISTLSLLWHNFINWSITVYLANNVVEDLFPMVAQFASPTSGGQVPD